MGGKELQVINIAGQIELQKNNQLKNSESGCKPLKPGLYFIRAESKERRSWKSL
jgi:hypothetical protein